MARIERLGTTQRLPLRQVKNFLLLNYPSALGTAIHAAPLVAALHAAVPGARVSVAASGLGMEIFRGNPGVEQLVETPNPLKNFWGAARVLRKKKFFGGQPFVAIQARGNERSKIALAALFGGIPRRVGFSVVPQIMEVAVEGDAAQSLIANNLHIVEALGHGPALQAALANDPNLAEPRLFLSAANVVRAHTLLAEHGIDESLPIAVFVTQTSVTQRKSWRAERFRAVAETLACEYGMQIVFVGTAGESAAIEVLRAPLTAANANVAGTTDIAELTALLGLADVALALDTGPMHLARSARLPMVIVAPAWSPEVEWLPLGNPRARILKNLTLPSPPPEDYWIDEVSVAEAEASLRELLKAYPARSFAWRA